MADLAGAVILSGIVIVFLALVILIGVVTLTGRITGAAQASKAAAPAPKVAPQGPVRTVLGPKVESGISGETVAVISAAVAAVMEAEAPGMGYAVTSVRRARQARPVWGFAGMQQNTRPF